MFYFLLYLLFWFILSYYYYKKELSGKINYSMEILMIFLIIPLFWPSAFIFLAPMQIIIIIWEFLQRNKNNFIEFLNNDIFSFKKDLTTKK